MDLDARVRALAGDRQRGAGALSEEALAILADAPDAQAARDVARALLRARPAMVAIENRVHAAMHAAMHDAPPAGGVAALRARCAELRARAAEEREAAARNAAQCLDGARILSISRSGTVQRALELAHAARPRTVVLPVGEPLRDGLAQARALALAGLEVELVPDLALARAALGCDAALVGADAILADGTVVNRAGTCLLALAMGLAHRPVWVAAEEAKVTWRSSLPVEEAPPPLPPQGLLPLRMPSPMFDATPPALVRGWVTERGARSVDELALTAEEHRARSAWASS